MFKKSEDHYRMLFNSGNDAIFVLQPDSHGNNLIFVDVNDIACSRLGYSREELLTKTPLDVVAPEYHHAVFKLIHEKHNPGFSAVNILEHVTKAGRRLPIESSIRVFDLAGIPTVLVISRSIAERLAAEDALSKSDHRFRVVFQSSPNAITISRLENGVFLDVNESFLKSTGFTYDEVVGHGAVELGIWADMAERFQFVDDLRRDGRVVDRELSIRRRSGETSYFSVSSTLIEIDGEQCIVTIGNDITERKRFDDLFYKEKERALVTLHSIGDAVITTDFLGTVDFLNPVAEELTGWTNLEAKGRDLAEIFKVVNETTRKPALNIAHECLSEGHVLDLSHYSVLVRRDGKEIAIEDSVAPIRDNEGAIIGMVLVFHDVSQARKMAHQLSWQATHDALTGLINRREFDNRLSQLISQAQSEGDYHVLLYLDLDQFKVVNDTCGHVAGDQLLKQLASIIQSNMRDSDTFARLGGDEFGILLGHCRLEKAERLANVLRETVKAFRFVWDDKTFEIGVSIGMIAITAESEDSITLLRNADMACYAAKDAGRNRIHVYEPGDSAVAKRKGEMEWIGRITRAFEENRFLLFRQTILSVDGQDHSEHYEVLMRMIDEEGNIVPPGAFLPAAERYGLMPTIDRWVIRKLFSIQGGHFRSSNRSCIGTGTDCHCLYAINLSGATLSDESFLEFVRDRLQEYNVPPEVICFEITETAAIANLPRAMHFIAELRAMGCRFSLDDFGSGVSSFAYLKNLPVDFLKIDGGFVRGITTDPIDLAMVESINHIGHVMGIKTIAECVENEAILQKLKAIGVDYAQGYHIEKPGPLDQLHDLLGAMPGARPGDQTSESP